MEYDWTSFLTHSNVEGLDHILPFLSTTYKSTVFLFINCSILVHQQALLVQKNLVLFAWIYKIHTTLLGVILLSVVDAFCHQGRAHEGVFNGSIVVACVMLSNEHVCLHPTSRVPMPLWFVVYSVVIRMLVL